MMMMMMMMIVNKGPVPLSRFLLVLDVVFCLVAVFSRGIFPVTFYPDTHIHADSFRSATLLAHPAEL